MMGDLYWLLWLRLVGGVLLILVSGVLLGRKLGDLRYQQAAKINGIRRIQATINVRMQAARVLLGIVFLSASIFILADLSLWMNVFLSRVLDIFVIIVFAANSLFDWRDEDRQLAIMQGDEHDT